MSTNALQVARTVNVSSEGAEVSWNLYGSTEAPMVYDLDLAERAGLARPRDIRRTIKAMAKSGLFGSAVTARATNQPYFQEILDVTSLGDRGAQQSTTSYLLNEAAALMVIMRLRTPRAIAVQKEVVQVYLAAKGGLVTTAPQLMAQVEARLLTRFEEKEAMLRAYVDEKTSRNYEPISKDPRKEFELKQTMKDLAAATGATFSAVHGAYKAVHRLVSYRDTPSWSYEANLNVLRRQLKDAIKVKEAREAARTSSIVEKYLDELAAEDKLTN